MSSMNRLLALGGPKLRAVADIDLPVLEEIGRVWQAFRKHDKRIPRNVVFTLQPRRPSSCNTVEWDREPVIVLNLKEGDRTLTGQEVVAWLAHQASHSANPRPPDAEGPSAEFTTSNATEGLYHTAGYRDAAEKLGLTAEHDRGRGWFKTTLTKPSLYSAEIRDLDRALKNWHPPVQRSATRGPLSVRCRCDELPTTLPAGRERPRVLRASIGVVQPEGPDKGTGIVCSYCGAEFALREATKRRTGSRG
jgi:hypothetical protein